MLNLSRSSPSGAFRYVTTTTITLSGAGGNASKQPLDRDQLVASPGQDSGRSESVRPSGGQLNGETHRETYISRWEGPSSSGASSIALSVDGKTWNGRSFLVKMGWASDERKKNSAFCSP